MPLLSHLSVFCVVLTLWKLFYVIILFFSFCSGEYIFLVPLSLRKPFTPYIQISLPIFAIILLYIYLSVCLSVCHFVQGSARNLHSFFLVHKKSVHSLKVLCVLTPFFCEQLSPAVTCFLLPPSPSPNKQKTLLKTYLK